MERSLITKDLWKKPHHYNETGRKCRGARGLAGLLQAKLKFWRDISVAET